MNQQIFNITNKVALNKISSEDAIKDIEAILIANDKKENEANTIIGITIHFNPMDKASALSQLNKLHDIIDEIDNVREIQHFLKEDK